MRDEILQQANIKDGFQLATANGETDALFIEPKQRLSEAPLATGAFLFGRRSWRPPATCLPQEKTCASRRTRVNKSRPRLT